MRTVFSALLSIWGCIYTGSVAWAVWKRGNHRGGFFTALLALAVLVLPVLIEYTVARQ